ncbi:unnamed protein product [Spirodela intermedia]|uniref:Uncharacterized protein n=1 Tax=Spirodela intermedia TaxID=51605 RepID=A0A7I8J1R8_SPIIN|nr:unnamed protein product [Spirodela intermedia]CAA6664164.1 unnamed protein product [Spirodela intermedia]
MPPMPHVPAAATARWLAVQNSRGASAQYQLDLQGTPFGNVVSFTVGEYPAVGSCGGADPENRTCAKLTLTGKVRFLADLKPDRYIYIHVNHINPCMEDSLGELDMGFYP